MKAVLCALALTFAPLAALAQGCGHDRQANISCSEGTVWDEATRSCIEQTS